MSTEACIEEIAAENASIKEFIADRDASEDLLRYYTENYTRRVLRGTSMMVNKMVAPINCLPWTTASSTTINTAAVLLLLLLLY